MTRIFVYGVIFACLMLTAGVLGAWSLFTGTPNQSASGQQGDLELSLTADRLVIFAGEEITFVFSLTNTGATNMTFWMGPPFFDVYLYDVNDALIAKWTEGKAFPAYLLPITLQPGENFSRTIQWNLSAFNPATGGVIPVNPGQYRISGVWLSESPIETSPLDLTVTEPDTPPTVTQFKAVVNELRSVDVYVCVDLTDGVTEQEAELIAGTTFIQVLGDQVTHRLDTLTVDAVHIDAHYTWGVDENDLGHIFDATVDLTTFQITVTHCF